MWISFLIKNKEKLIYGLVHMSCWLLCSCSEAWGCWQVWSEHVEQLHQKPGSLICSSASSKNSVTLKDLFWIHAAPPAGCWGITASYRAAQQVSLSHTLSCTRRQYISVFEVFLFARLVPAAWTVTLLHPKRLKMRILKTQRDGRLDCGWTDFLHATTQSFSVMM